VILSFLTVYLNKRRKNITLMVFDEIILKRILPQKIIKIRKTKDVLFLSALLLMVFAASGPQWGSEYIEKPIYSSNVAIVVDTSLSMSARDIKPTRLENLKISLKSIIENLTSHRIALFAFQDKAYLQCPLTDDMDAVGYFTDILYPDMLPYPGTNIADAIITATQYLISYNGEKYIILLTDGEDHSKKVDEAIKLAKENNVKIITVGIGTPEGDLIYDENTKEYKKDKYGRTVISKLDENTLIKIAQETNGKYIRYTSPTYTSDEIIKHISKSKAQGTKKIQRYKNRFQYFLLLSLILFLIEFISMEKVKIPTIILILLLPIFLNNPLECGIKSEFMGEKGNSAYKKQNYEKAKSIYEEALQKDRTNDKIRFNLANSNYRSKNFDEAIKNYEGISDKKIKIKAMYNMANSYAKKNEIDKAIELYKEVIISDPSNKNAQYNLELLLKRKKTSCSSSSSNSNSKSSSENKDNKDKNKGGEKNNEKDKSENKENKSEAQKQAERFLDMMKNIEKTNMKQINLKKENFSGIKNEFDW
jgi:Ca-activated chloride channel family protein